MHCSQFAAHQAQSIYQFVSISFILLLDRFFTSFHLLFFFHMFFRFLFVRCHSRHLLLLSFVFAFRTKKNEKKTTFKQKEERRKNFNSTSVLRARNASSMFSLTDAHIVRSRTTLTWCNRFGVDSIRGISFRELPKKIVTFLHTRNKTIWKNDDLCYAYEYIFNLSAHI